MKLIEAAGNKKRGTLRKSRNYFDIYDLHLSKFKNREINLLEIGVAFGGSLWMWKEYFPKAAIYGLDIDEECRRHEGEGVIIMTGDQTSPADLKEISDRAGGFDIVIDDGGHEMNQQKTAFDTLFPLLNDGGVYIVEDVFTSYMDDFQNRGVPPFLSYMKQMVDKVNWWSKRGMPIPTETNFSHILEAIDKLDPFERNLHSIHFYDGMCVVDKKRFEDNHIIRL